MKTKTVLGASDGIDCELAYFGTKEIYQLIFLLDDKVPLAERGILAGFR